MLINLTGSLLTFLEKDGKVMVEVPSSSTAYVNLRTHHHKGGFIHGGMVIPFHVSRYEEVKGIPEPKEGVWFIVSSTIAEVSGREDLLVPSGPIRDSKGKVLGYTGLESPAFSKNKDREWWEGLDISLQP